MRRWVLGLGLLIVASACPAGDESVPVSVVDAGAADVDAGLEDAGLATLATVVTAQYADGGVASVEASATVDPPASLTVRLPRRLKDLRVRLMDHQDKLVVSDDALSADGLEYVVTPAEPLKTGRSYTVLLDAELGPVIVDELGGTFDDWALPFTIAGEVQPEPAPVKSSKTATKAKAKPKAKKRR